MPISGRAPASEQGQHPDPQGDADEAAARTKTADLKARFNITSTGPGTAHIFLWSGDHASIPVWLTSCNPLDDPAPDYGFTPCAVTDGGIPAWSPDMSGRVVNQTDVTFSARGTQNVQISLTRAQYDKLVSNGSALISFENPANEVQAFAITLPDKVQ